MSASTTPAKAATALRGPDSASLVSQVGLERFQAVLSELEPLLKRLLDSPKHPRLKHGRGAIPRAPGVHLFSDADGRSLYVGQSRNLNRRLAEHCRDSSDHNKASFAFNIAKKTSAGAGVDITGFRADLVAREGFEVHFSAAKRLVAKMPVQFVVDARVDLRTVFEVYATYALGTEGYNTSRPTSRTLRVAPARVTPSSAWRCAMRGQVRSAQLRLAQSPRAQFVPAARARTPSAPGSDARAPQ